MFDLNTIKVLHLEPTTVCQASCPQCDRENPDLYNDEINRCNLTLEQIQQVIPQKVVKNLDKVFACGTFGDPASSKELLNIFSWFRKINPKITLGMNTNGGLRNTHWWSKLGYLFSNPLDYVVFSIDGLEDTNHLYRRNVEWSKLVKNINAYIKTGASAHWDMLVFEHNKHQIQDSENTARDLGFTWFRCKVSKRFNLIPVVGLNPPDNLQIPNISNPDTIDCHAFREQSLYLASNGELLPCCWIGSRIFNRDKVIDKALKTTNFQGVVQSWQEKPLHVCLENCGTKKNSTSSFQRQWVREKQLK